MDWTVKNLGESLKFYKQKLELVVDDHEITDKKVIARKIKIGLGDEGLKRLNNSGLTDDQLKDPKSIWDYLEKQLKTDVNFRIQRLLLMQFRQQPDETLDEFVLRAHAQAMLCDFATKEMEERIIELVIASTPLDEYRRELLSFDKTLTLSKAVEQGRKHEAAKEGTEKLKNLQTDPPLEAKMDALKRHGNKCGRCGQTHPRKRCPAYNDTSDQTL